MRWFVLFIILLFSGVHGVVGAVPFNQEYSNNIGLLGFVEKPPVDDSTLIYLDFSQYYLGEDGYYYFKNLGKLSDARVWNPDGVQVVGTPIGAGVHLDGNSYLWIPTQPEYNSLCRFSLVLVFLGDDPPTQEQILINKENHVEVGKYITSDYTNLPGSISFALSRRWDWIGSGVVDSSYWKVFILTYDGRFARVYVNGKLVHSYDYGSYACLPSRPSNWMVGARGGDDNINNVFSSTFSYAYAGNIAFVGFWLRTFSEDEVLRVSNYFFYKLYGSFVNSSDDVLLYFDWSNLVDKSEKVFVDKSGYGNVGAPYDPASVQVSDIDGKHVVYLSNNYIHIDRGYLFEGGLCTFSVIMEVYPTRTYSDFHILINKELQFEIGYKSSMFGFALRRKWEWYYSPANYPPNQWYTLLLVYDGEYGELYVNGGLAVRYYYGSFACNPSYPSNIWIGARGWSKSSPDSVHNMFKINVPRYNNPGYYGKVVIVDRPITWDEALQYLQKPPVTQPDQVKLNFRSIEFK